MKIVVLKEPRVKHKLQLVYSIKRTDITPPVHTQWTKEMDMGRLLLNVLDNLSLSQTIFLT